VIPNAVLALDHPQAALHVRINGKQSPTESASIATTRVENMPMKGDHVRLAPSKIARAAIIIPPASNVKMAST